MRKLIRMVKEVMSKLGIDFSFRVVALILLQVGVFLMDLSLPFSAATVVAYIAVIQFTLWLPKSQHTLYASISSTIFIVLAFFWELPEAPLLPILINRGIALSAVWITAMFVLRYERSVMKIGESESFKVLFKAAGEGLIIVNKWGDIVSANPELSKMFGYTEQELTGKRLKELIPERFWDRYKAFKQTFYQEPEIIHIGEASGKETFFGLRKDGKEFPVEVGVGFYKTVGEVLTVIFVADITQRKEVEKQISESNEWLANFMDSSPAYISILDKELKIVDCNRSMLSVFNSNTKEEVVGRYFSDLYPGIDKNTDLDKYETVLKTGERVVFDQEVEHPLFGHKYFNIHVFKAGDGLGSIIEDVTMEKQAEKKITESNERLSNFIDSTNDYITILDKNLNIVDCNKPILKMFNVGTKEEVIGRALVALAPEIATSGLLELYEKVLKTGEREEYEQKVEHPLLGHKHFNIRLFRADDGLGTIIEDITKRKQAERELQLKDREYKMLVESSNEFIYRCDLKGKFVYTNPAVAKATEYTEEELKGKHFSHLVRPDYKRQVMAFYYDQLNKLKEVTNLEFPILTKSKKEIWLRQTVQLKYDETNPEQVKELTIISHNITEHRKLENQLIQSENKFRGVFNSMVDLFTRINNEGIVEMVSPSVYNILGYETEDILHKKAKDFYVHPEDRDKLIQTIKEFGSCQNFLAPIKAKNGEERIVSINAKIYADENGNPLGIEAISRDITDLKKAEDKLKENEEQLRALSENAPGYIMRIDEKGIIQYINKDMSGLQRDQLIGSSIYDYFKENYHQEFEENLKKTLMSGVSTIFELHGFAIENQPKWYSNQLVLLDNGDREKEIEVLAMDITARKIAEIQLTENLEHLNTILETSQDAIISANEKGKIQYFNPAAEKFFGYTKDEIVGKPLITLMPERYIEKHNKGFAHYNSTGEARLVGKGVVELFGKKKNGKEFPMEMTLATWNTKKGKFFTAMIRDTEQHKNLEKKLEELQTSLR